MGRRTQDDPRYQRVRAALVDAVVELAASDPAERIGVSQVTALAGVSRTTFYSHASSPADLLADHLVAELSPCLDELNGLLERDPQHYLLGWRAVCVKILSTVALRPEVYSRVFLDSGQSLVQARLRRRIEGTMERYVGEFAARLDQPASELWVSMAVAQQVHNILVMVVSWLRSGMADDPETVVNTFISLAPPWQLVRLREGEPTTLGRVRLRRALEREASGRERRAEPGTAH